MQTLRIALAFSLASTHLPLAAAKEDTNLAGCSVELSSYFYNLQKLSRNE
jgi:hypothetical protein